MLLEVRYQICTIRFLLQTSEYHLCTRDVLFRVFQIDEQCLSRPRDVYRASDTTHISPTSAWVYNKLET